MKKLLIVGLLMLATLYSVQAQTTNPSSSTAPITDGTTKNSGSGNASNGSSSAIGDSTPSGAVGANNGTSYGMQSTAPSNSTATGSSRRKGAKGKTTKNN